MPTQTSPRTSPDTVDSPPDDAEPQPDDPLAPADLPGVRADVEPEADADDDALLPGDEAPLVQLVLVASDPGPWFAETLASIAAQDYPALSVLAVDAGSPDPDALAARIRAVLPAARIVAGDGRSFSRAANRVLSEGTTAPFLVFCHDDVRLDPSAVRLLVEETFRSNGGVIGAKLVEWDRPDHLLQVGMSVDKTGAPAPLIDPGELDQEQHDSVRDVFYVPGGCTLVRADLFGVLGGFDPEMEVGGEELDLGWRAQVAGARVLVVPAARAAHRQALADRRSPIEVRRLIRQHRVRTVLTCYSAGHLARVLPQALFLAFLEVLFALLTGQVDDARVVLGAWRSGLRDHGQIRERRKALAAIRQVKDSDLRHLQVHGSAQVSAYLRGQITRGDERYQGVGGVGRSLALRLHEAGAQRTVLIWLVVLFLLVLGSRHLITRPIPTFGELVVFPASSADALREYRSTGTLAGLGGEAAVPPMLGAVGLVGMFVAGKLALLRTLLVIGSLLVGMVGAWRLPQPIGSRRAQMVALVAYGSVPVGFNAVGRGHLSGLVAYALAPFLVAALARVGGGAPFPARRSVHVVLVLGLLLAVGGLVVPAMVLLGPLVALGLVAGSLLSGRPAGSARLLGVSLAATGLALVLLLPWSLTWWTQWDTFGRPRQSPVDVPTASDLLRFATGDLGSSPLSWGLLVAASLALLIGREWRLSWAIRGWFVALTCWVVAFAGTQGWLPVPLPPLEVLLAPAAAGLVLALSMGVAAFEIDLRDFHFGWRQLVSVVAGAAFVFGVLPALGDAVVDGRWGSPTRGLDQTIAFIEDDRAEAEFRVLWLGDPEILPLTGWTYDDSVTYQVTSTGVPELRDIFPGPVHGAGATLRDALDAAAEGTTSRLGAEISPLDIRYVVLPEQIAPSTGTAVVPDSPLVGALPEQLDLAELDVSSAVRVWENAAWVEGDVPSEAEPATGRTLVLVVGVLAWLATLAMAIRTRGAR